MKNLLYICLLCLSLIACKDENSIQTFFVEHQEEPSYSLVDISKTLIDFSDTDLTKDEREAYKALEKLHVLMYKATDSTQDAYTKELKQIQKVFKNPDYSELMQFSSDGMKFKISSIGEENTVDEVLVLASSNTMGFAAIRVLGDDMSPEKIAALISKMKDANVDDNKLKGIMDFLK